MKMIWSLKLKNNIYTFWFHGTFVLTQKQRNLLNYLYHKQQWQEYKKYLSLTQFVYKYIYRR